MKLVSFLQITSLALVSGLSTAPSRRDLLSAALVASASALLPQSAQAEDALTSVYFGVGCFWHIQHEFIVGERDILGRSDAELTALAGYAGGKATDAEGRVCYHNFQRVADYGKLGHGEVVGMKIPANKIEDFTKLYFSLYDPRTKGVSSSRFVGRSVLYSHIDRRSC